MAELYSLASGAKINKSVGLWLGAERGNRECPACIQWSSDSLRFYGVYLGDGDVVVENHNKLLPKFFRKIDSVKTRGLDLVSKIEIVNTFACSMVWHVGISVPLDSAIMNKYIRYAFQFLWNKSIEWVARIIMYNDIHN